MDSEAHNEFNEDISLIPSILVQISTTEEESRALEKFTSQGHKATLTSTGSKMKIKRNGEIEVIGGSYTIVVDSKDIVEFKAKTNIYLEQLNKEHQQALNDLEEEKKNSLIMINNEKTEKMKKIAKEHYEENLVKEKEFKDNQLSLINFHESQKLKLLQENKDNEKEIEKRLNEEREKYNKKVQDNIKILENARKDAHSLLSEKEKQLNNEKNRNQLNNERVQREMTKFEQELNQNLQNYRNKLNSIRF